MMPLGWSLYGLIVHISSYIAIRTRLRASYRFTVPSLGHSKTCQRVLDGRDSILSDTLLAVTTLFAILQLIFGTLILSSLVFISAFEAVQVFGLYALSTVVVLCVLLLELAYMEEALNQAATTSQSVDRSRD